MEINIVQYDIHFVIKKTLHLVMGSCSYFLLITIKLNKKTGIIWSMYIILNSFIRIISFEEESY